MSRNNPRVGGGPRSARLLVRESNVGTRLISMRLGNFDNTTQQTFRVMAEIAADNFTAVRPIFTNGNNGGTYTVASFNARALPNFTDAVPAPTSGTLPSGGVVPASPGGNQPNYLLGDWVYLPSVTRTDGGVGAVVCFDAYVSTSGTLSILGNNTNDVYTGWATRSSRKFLFRHNAGDCVTTPANFVSTTNRNQSIFAGLQYIANGRVITVMGVGDSITDGRGSIIGEGFGVPACEALSRVTGTVYEWANAGYAGALSATYANYIATLTTAGIKPDIVVMANGSPNDNGSTITDANITSSQQSLAKMLLACRDNLYLPVLWTYLPTNPAVKPYQATDAKRVAYHTLTRQRQNHVVLDFAAALSGVTDGNGQVNMLAGTTTDNIHPNDTGNAIMSRMLANALRSLTP